MGADGAAEAGVAEDGASAGGPDSRIATGVDGWTGAGTMSVCAGGALAPPGTATEDWAGSAKPAGGRADLAAACAGSGPAKEVAGEAAATLGGSDFSTISTAFPTLTVGVGELTTGLRPGGLDEVEPAAEPSMGAAISH